MKRILSICVFFLILQGAAHDAHSQWKLTALPLFPLSGSNFGVLCSYENTLWLGYSKIFCSFDGGKTWQDRSPKDAHSITDIQFFDANSIIVSTIEKKAFLSYD